jgi:soluble lytic murein transglycosylase-like protein
VRSTKISQAQADFAALVQQAREAPGIPTFWLPISYVMAHVQIESGFDPTIKASDFATTGSVGLMQVTVATAGDIHIRYPQLGVDQTDPYTSIAYGMIDLHDCKQYLRYMANLPYMLICMAYNVGEGAVSRGVRDWPYYYKWLSCQPAWAFLDNGFKYGDVNE